jgi:hypothetical protein
MMQFLAGESVTDTFRVAVDVFGRLNADAEELRSLISEPLRQSFRRYLKEGISKLLDYDLFDDSTRSHAAIALARIGDSEDLVDLRRMIDADIQRQKTRPNATTYSNWYVRALLWLDIADVDATLIELLREQKYEGEAARGLLQSHSTRETGGLGHVRAGVARPDPACLQHMQRGPHARSSCRRWLRLQRSPRSPHRLPLIS